MLSYTKDRILVPLDSDRGVIYPEWLEARGKVLLPSVWTEDAWSDQDKDTKRFIYSCLVDFPYWFRHIFLPHKSQMELGIGDEELSALYPEGLPPYMLEYCNDLQSACPLSLLPYEKKVEKDGSWRLCRVFSTGLFKSTITCEAWPLYLIGCNPNITILLAVLAKDKGDRFITAAKTHIQRNKLFVWLHGDLYDDSPKKTWRTDCIEVKRPLDRSAPTIELVGYRGAIEGERYDIAAVDDVVGPENCITDESRTRTEAWLDGPVAGRLNPTTRMLLVIGTPHHGDDVYARKKKAAGDKGTWDYKEVAALSGGTWPPRRKTRDEPYSKDNVIVPTDVTLAWPQWWPIEKLVDEWIENPTTFARQRQLLVRDPASKQFPLVLLNDCKADGGQRSDEVLKPLLSRWPVEIGVPEEGSDLYRLYRDGGLTPEAFKRVISVDLACTEKNAENDPDYTVFQLWALDNLTGARVILNQWRRRTSRPQVIGKHLGDWVEAYKPHKLLVEANAVDKLFARTLQEVLGFPVIITEFAANKWDDIESFRDLGEAGLVWIPWARDNIKTIYVFESFVSELYDWPDGAHDDTLATAAHACTELKVRSGGVRALILRPNQRGDIIEGEDSDANGLDEGKRSLVTRASPKRDKRPAFARLPEGLKKTFLRGRGPIGGIHHDRK